MRRITTSKKTAYQLIDELRDAIELTCDKTRERSLALTKLDECEMWLDRSRPRETAAPGLSEAAANAAAPGLSDAVAKVPAPVFGLGA